jgi:quercetin dioxygenase-like cupin family protein
VYRAYDDGSRVINLGGNNMTIRHHVFYGVLAVSMSFAAAGNALAAEAGSHVQNVAQMKFVNMPGMPTCTQGSVLKGDPSKEPSIILAKASKGCSFPWHWHTPSEHLMMVSGTAVAETKDSGPLTLKPGGFALMPSKHVHRFRCTSACELYLYADAPFDMHYVDAQDKELTPDEALKAVKETAAK